MTLSASGLASAITNAQGPAQDTGLQNSANMKLANAIISYLVANSVITVTIQPSSIVTVGTAATQTGPAAPLPVTGTLS